MITLLTLGYYYNGIGRIIEYFGLLVIILILIRDFMTMILKENIFGFDNRMIRH